MLRFCVLRGKGIAELKKEGIFAGALIEKKQYWFALAPGEAYDKYFEIKEVGDTDNVSSKSNRLDYSTWGMKESIMLRKLLGVVVH
ncbi:hypothetical protein ACHAXS_003738 [Conticribra weissflogii]